MALGFCLFNNVAILARYLQRQHGLNNIAILDWDVHHGNGTQHTFEEDPSVLYVSLHQYPYYPGTGGPHETGIGRGRGATLNCPMRAGATDSAYQRAFSEQVLPALNLSLFKLALMIRLARAGTREVMLGETVRFARAAGLREGTILRRHVLKLIAIPLVTVFGLELASTLAFAVVTETIFSWPGVGKLIIDSISTLDRPVMVSYLVLVAFLFITINLIVDLSYALLDPRIRRGRG